jgi:hypothetical protein
MFTIYRVPPCRGPRSKAAASPCWPFAGLLTLENATNVIAGLAICLRHLHAVFGSHRASVLHDQSTKESRDRAGACCITCCKSREWPIIFKSTTKKEKQDQSACKKINGRSDERGDEKSAANSSTTIASRVRKAGNQRRDNPTT